MFSSLHPRLVRTVPHAVESAINDPRWIAFNQICFRFRSEARRVQLAFAEGTAAQPKVHQDQHSRRHDGGPTRRLRWT